MNEIKVSIIIPVYNVAQYLRRCLDSCIHQTMQEIEIIVINDCSPDPQDTEIMREYGARYPHKFQCIWHRENKKLGAARNTGIRAAKGEFVYFLDSDDYIEPTLCQKMYDAIVATDADMSVCDCDRIEKHIVTAHWCSNGDFLSNDLKIRMKSLRLHAAWLIMIKKNVILKNNLYFPDALGFEDIQCLFWYLAAGKIVRVKEVLYHYVVRSDSIIQNHMLDTYETNLEIVLSIMQSDFFQTLDKEVKEMVLIYVMRMALGWTSMVNLCYPASLGDYCKKLLEIEKVIRFDMNVVTYKSENTTYVKNLFSFIRKNIGAADFCLQYSAFFSYQTDLCSLKLCYYRLQKFEGKRITIWGAGRRGERICVLLKRLGIPIEVTDIDGNLYNKKIAYNTVVKPWDELRPHTDVVISSVVRHFEEIRDAVLKESPGLEVIDSDELLRWSL